MYVLTGKQEKEKSDPFLGHPWGKKPNAMLRALLVCFTENFASPVAASFKDNAEIQGAWGVILHAARLARAGDPSIISTRCFRVQLQDASVVRSRWIFAAQRLAEVVSAFQVLQKHHVTDELGVIVDDDTAPKSGTSQKIHNLIYGATSKGSGRGRIKRK